MYNIKLVVYELNIIFIKLYFILMLFLWFIVFLIVEIIDLIGWKLVK